jgi:hypothetical protein
VTRGPTVVIVVALVAGLFLSTCGAGVRGSGNVTSESRDVSDFDEVVLEGIGNLTIQQTGSETLTIEAEDNIIPYLKTEVEGDRLVIGVEDNTTINSSEPINYRLTVKDLNALTLSGSGNIATTAISTDELALTVSGSGNIGAPDTSTDELQVELSGSGSVRAAGKTDSQDIDIPGSGSYDAEDLESRETEIDLGGSGRATVNVSDELDVRISGSGSVEYSGDPTVSQDISGSGNVRQR